MGEVIAAEVSGVAALR